MADLHCGECNCADLADVAMQAHTWLSGDLDHMSSAKIIVHAEWRGAQQTKVCLKSSSHAHVACV